MAFHQALTDLRSVSKYSIICNTTLIYFINGIIAKHILPSKQITDKHEQTLLIILLTGSVTITIKSRTDGASTCSRMNLFGYVGHYDYI